MKLKNIYLIKPCTTLEPDLRLRFEFSDESSVPRYVEIPFNKGQDLEIVVQSLQYLLVLIRSDCVSPDEGA